MSSPIVRAKLEKSKASSAATREICFAIQQHDKQIREDYPFLNYQDQLGMGFFLSALAVMAVISYGYLNENLHPILTILLMGIPISILHELEHDLIHNLYFKKFPLVQDIMFFFIWVSKLHGSPWFRRELHLEHHKRSGQEDDAEERLIGLGLPYGFNRLAVTIHPLGSVLVSNQVARDSSWFDRNRMTTTSLPVISIWLILTKAYLAYCLSFIITSYFPSATFLPLFPSLWPLVRDLNILFCFPNILRQACLVLMSNSSHYFGDIPLLDVFYQNQILDHWCLLVFQLFCFNFGSTHIIHHYVVGQPFYIRQLTAIAVKDKMVSLGVRRNDFGILWRANRYQKDNEAETTANIMGILWFIIFSTVGFACVVIFDFMIAIQSGKNIVKVLSRRRGKRPPHHPTPTPENVDNGVKSE
jgi:fatty acid desaturase